MLFLRAVCALGARKIDVTDQEKNLNLPVNPGAALDYELLLDCVHCGLCTSACPTYVETGDENESPRGRIYLMRGVTDGKLELNDRVRGHLELCLDCRACETACPSGVQYGKLIEPFRVAMDAADGNAKQNDWFHRWVLFGLFPYARKLRRALKGRASDIGIGTGEVDHVWRFSVRNRGRILPRGRREQIGGA